MQQTQTRNARPYADNGYFSDISKDSNLYLSHREPNVGTMPTYLPDRKFSTLNSQLSILNSQLKKAVRYAS